MHVFYTNVKRAFSGVVLTINFPVVLSPIDVERKRI